MGENGERSDNCALNAKFAAAEEDGGLPEFMRKSRGAALLRGTVAPTALKKHVDEWGEKFLGPAWRLYAQMMHWQLQTPRMDYLKEAAPRGAVRPITCLVIEMLLQLEFPGKTYAEKMKGKKWIATHVAPGLDFIGFNALVKVGKDFKKTNGSRGGKDTPEKKRKREEAKRKREEKAAEREEAKRKRDENAAATERAKAACLAQAKATGLKSRFFGVSWARQKKRWKVQAKNKFVGNYYDVNDAARAFDDYVISNKIDTRLNIPNARGAAGHETTKKERTSRQRGVCRAKGGKWRAQIYFDGKVQSLGTFVDEDEAGRAYRAAACDKAAREHDNARPRKRKR